MAHHHDSEEYESAEEIYEEEEEIEEVEVEEEEEEGAEVLQVLTTFVALEGQILFCWPSSHFLWLVLMSHDNLL